MKAAPPVQLVAVVGGSGAGKGWLVERLCRVIGGQAGRLQLDDFYRDCSHLPPARRAQVNFDLPEAIDWEWMERVLQDCAAGQTTTLPSYDFATHCRRQDRRAWTPPPLVFVDGLWLLRPPAVRRRFDLRLYLDTPGDLRCSRRLARDVVERGYSREAIDRQLRTAVLPMHARYVEPQKRHADLVLHQPFEEPELLQLADRLWEILHRAAVVHPWQHETFRAELVGILAHHEFCH